MAIKLSKRKKHNESLKPQAALDPLPACEAIKKFKAPKFDQTVNVVLNLGIDPKQADQAIRGSVSLPKGIGKTKRVVAFCREDQIGPSKANGAVEAGAEDLVAKIEAGWMDFDVAIASPDMMRVVSKLGKVLGPKGLMPSPKSGTVTPNVADAVKEYSAGKVEYRNDAGSNVHAVIGKMSFGASDLAANLEHFIHHIERSRPSTAKGTFIKKVVISGSMTPGVEVKVAQKVVE
ncbi:MAG TPA: 50S ribosomal protein L1 [Solirubrobacterales bacterium]|nr:50S ribosomal protein L1 [Solirubrobacterales bacterium]